jgi:DNA polymerase III delta subunit
MIYLYLGEDTILARKKLREAVDKLVARVPDADVLTINDENYGDESIDLLLREQGLFYKKRILILDGVFSTDEPEAYLKALKGMEQSEHVIFVLERKLDAKTRKLFEKHAAKITEFDTAEKKAAHFDGFAIADHLGSKNRNELWLAYRRGILRGEPAERIYGLLFWAAKALYAAAISETPKDAGLKEYPFTKSKRAAKNFTQKELARIVADLSELPATANMEMEYALERFVLSI